MEDEQSQPKPQQVQTESSGGAGDHPLPTPPQDPEGDEKVRERHEEAIREVREDPR